MGSVRENSIKLAGDNVGFHVGSSDAVFVSDFGPRLEGEASFVLLLFLGP